MKLPDPERQQDELTKQLCKHAGKYRKKVVGSLSVTKHQRPEKLQCGFRSMVVRFMSGSYDH